MQVDPQVVSGIYRSIVKQYTLVPGLFALIIVFCIISCIKTAIKERPRDKNEREKWLQSRKAERQKLKKELLEEKQALKQEVNANDRKLKAKYRRHKRRYRRRVLNDAFVKIWLPILITLLVVIVSVPVFMFSLVTYELNHEQFVVYEGPVEIVSERRVYFTFRSVTASYFETTCYIPTENGKKDGIDTAYFQPNFGQYTGRIVYTKHSKFAVSMDLEPLP